MVWEAYGKGVPLLGVRGEIPKVPVAFGHFVQLE